MPTTKPRRSALETATSRRRLEPRKKPYWITISPGIALGYRRNQGGVGTWSVRVAESGSEWVKRIAHADDLEAASPPHILNYWMALDAARLLARRQPGAAADESRPLTVAEALDKYADDLRSRGADQYNATRARFHLTGALLSKPVSMLSAGELRKWRDTLSARGLSPATVNRTRTVLRAALELVASLDHRIGNRDAFRLGLKGLPNATKARRMVLPDADVLRIVEAAYQEDRALGLLVEVLAQTGARISQATRLRCSDLQPDRHDPRLLMPTSFKGRGQKERQHVPVPITTSLAALLKHARGNRAADARLLLRHNGTAWRPKGNDYVRLFREAVRRAGLDHQITSYTLRHSSIARSLIKGVPTSIVARTHDTSTKEIEAHYAAFIADFSDSLSRKALLQPGPPTADNVVTLPGGRP
jgi:integrase